MPAAEMKKVKKRVENAVKKLQNLEKAGITQISLVILGEAAEPGAARIVRRRMQHVS